MADELKVNVKVDVGKAVKNLEQLSKKAKDAGESVEDMEVNAKNVARAMDALADNMIADMKASEAAADALAAALGPEMATKIGAARIDELIADVRRAGIEFDDLAANADQFADVLRKTASAGDGLKDVERAVQRVGAETDNTRSVFANFAGNAAQELPGVATALGPVNMAISQFVEYAAEGNIKLSEMLKFAGPMAGIGVAVALVANHMEQVAKANAFKTARIEEFTKALKEGATAAEAWDAALTDDGNKVEFVNAATGDVADLTAVLADNNVTWDEFRQHLMSGRDAFEEWARATFPAKDGQTDLNHALQAGWQIMDDYAAAQKTAIDRAEVYGVAVDENSKSLDRGRDSLVKHMDATTADALATDSLTEAAEEAEAALQSYHDTMRASVDANFALFDAQNDLTQSLQDLAETTDDPKTAINELDIATAEAAQSAFGLADAQVAQADAAAKAAGKTLTAAEKNDILVGSLEATAAQLAPGSPLRVQLEMYIAALKRVPANVTTAMSIAAGSGGYSAAGLVGGTKRSATGTSSAPGGAMLVGEQGPEIVMLPNGAQVLSHGRTQQAMQGGGGSAAPMVVNIYPRTMPTERELIDLVNGIRRKQGQVI
jgi:hypothetical protein